MYLYMFWIPQYLSDRAFRDAGRHRPPGVDSFPHAGHREYAGRFRLRSAGPRGLVDRRGPQDGDGRRGDADADFHLVDVRRADGRGRGTDGVQMFAHGFWITNYITLTGDLLPPRSVGTVVGLCGCAGGLSGFVTTKLVGLVVDRFSFVPVFVAAGVMYPIGFLVILLTIGRVQRIGRKTAAPTS